MNSTRKTTYGYSRSHRAVEIVCIATVGVLLAGFAIKVSRTIHTPSGWVNLVLTGLCGYLASDVVSGTVHWIGDTLGDEGVPFFGLNFIRPFREHHVDQKAITRHDFVETNGNNCIIVVAPLAFAFLLMPGAESFWFFSATFMAFLALFVVATNQFHKWAHADAPPAIARELQRWGLILPPRHHDIHHAAPHDKQYCITVGWMNPVLNGIRFFRAAEWLVARFRPTWLHIEDRTRVAAKKATATASATPSVPASLATVAGVTMDHPPATP